MERKQKKLEAGPCGRRSPVLRRPRRGSAYVLILMVASLVAVIGLSALNVERVRAHRVPAQNDWEEAGMLATSAVENALVTINAATGWRSLFSNNTPSAPIALGRGTYQWKLVDEIDGNLGNDISQPVRLYGIGRVGQAVRIYSVLLPGTTGPDVFRTAVASCKDILSTGTLTLIGGPLFTTGKYTSGTLTTGDVEAASVTNRSMITGTVTTPPPSRVMPSSSVYDTYLPLATDIPFNDIPLAQISGKVLSAASNPYGTANAQGIYKISVRAGTTLTITNSRLVATLLIELLAGATLNVGNTNLWETPAGNYPILIIKSTSTATVRLSASAATLNEWSSLVNYNPAGTPYNGQSDTDTTDSYPNTLNGFIHIIGASVSTTLSQITLGKTIFSEGPITLTSNVTINVDPALFSNPPMGYTTTSQVYPTPGTWRWEVLP
jgi:hypothetical protein